MKNKTESKIIEILSKTEDLLEASQITKEIGLTYDTIARHLKRMTNERILTREAIAVKRKNRYSWESNYEPWQYYYKLNIKYQ